MDDMARCGVSGYSVVVTKRLSEEEGQDPKDLYMETFGDLLRLIKDEGPDGLYRIRIDESDWFDRGEFEKKAAAILKGPKKKLAKRNGVMSADSDLVPGIQAADIMVGEQRRVLGRQSESSFMRQHHMKKRQKTKLTREYGKRCGCRLRPDEGGRC